MRAGSQRVKDKNIKDFAGKPLFAYIVGELLKAENVAEVVIDSDSPQILDLVVSKFPTVKTNLRPKHLGQGHIPMNEVLLNTCNKFDADFYLQTHSTNPLLSAQTINNAVITFLKNHPAFDSLFGVTKIQNRFYDQLARPINHNQNILLPTQNLPPFYMENSCIYLFEKETLTKNFNRIGTRPYLYEINKIESIDIDDEFDFELAEYVYKQKYNQ